MIGVSGLKNINDGLLAGMVDVRHIISSAFARDLNTLAFKASPVDNMSRTASCLNSGV